MSAKDDVSPQPGAAESFDHAQARKRLQARRDFGSHLVAYIVFNGFMVLIWAVTGAGYFWPGWILGCWGAGLVMHAWDAFVRRPVTEAEIDAEMRRMT